MKTKKDIIAIAAITAAVLLAYLNTLPGAFIHDDIPEIVDNPYIKDPRYLTAIFTSPAWAFEYTRERSGISNYYRPLQYLIYSGLYRIWGLNPFGFHLFKLLLHLFTTLLVYLLLKKYFMEFRAALIAAILFALHPIHTAAVTWISGITDALVTPFILLSFLCYLKSMGPCAKRRAFFNKTYYFFSLLFFFLGLFAKETAVMAFLLIMLYDLLWSCERSRSKRFLGYLPYAAIFIVYLVFRVNAIGSFKVAGYKYADLTRLQCLLNPVCLAASYLIKALIPLNQCGWYVFHPVLRAGDPRFLLSLLLLAALSVIAVFFALKRRKLELFFLLWFFCALAPVIVMFRQIGLNVFAERYLYLPGVGFCALLALELNRLRRRLFFFIVILLADICLLLTVKRNAVWRDRLTFWTATVKSSPDSSIARNNLGVCYHLRERYDEAEAEYREAARLMFDNPTPRLNLALIYLERGLYPEALAACEAALAVRPDYADAYETRGSVLMKMDRPNEALAAFRTAVEIQPLRADTLIKIGEAHRELGDLDRAEASFQKALRIDPASLSARISLGALYEKKDMPAEAERVFLEAVRFTPGSAEAHINLASIYGKTGRAEEAIEALYAARRADPESAETRYRLAVLFSNAGRFSDAVREYLEAIRLNAEHAGAHVGLGVLLGMAGKYSEAERMLRRAPEIEPDSADARFNLCVLYRKTGKEEEFRKEAIVLRKLSPELAETLMEKSLSYPFPGI